MGVAARGCGKSCGGVSDRSSDENVEFVTEEASVGCRRRGWACDVGPRPVYVFKVVVVDGHLRYTACAFSGLGAACAFAGVGTALPVAGARL